MCHIIHVEGKLKSNIQIWERERERERERLFDGGHVKDWMTNIDNLLCGRETYEKWNL